jgi:hypothetical protein
MLLRAEDSEMKVCRSQARLQTHSFGEGSRSLIELSLLSQDRSEIVAKISSLRSETHSSLQLRDGLYV